MVMAIMKINTKLRNINTSLSGKHRLQFGQFRPKLLTGVPQSGQGFIDIVDALF
jgi:hypothetical protein